LSFTLVSGLPTYAKTKTEIKNQLSASQEKEKDAKAEYEAKKEKEAELEAEIKTLEKRIASTEAELKVLEGKIASNNEEIKAIEAEIVSMEANVQQQTDDLSARLRMMYESGDGSLVEVLLGSENITDFIGGLDIVKKIHAYDMEVLDDLNAQLAKIEEKKAELDAIRQTLKTNQDSQIQKRESLASDKKKLVAAEAQAHKETVEAQEDYEAAQKASDALESELRNYRSPNEWTGTVMTGNGRLGWPCSGRITSEYGYRIRPNYGYSQLHSGIDIAVPTGTPIRAAESGVVYSAGWKGSYGNCVIIDHGNMEGKSITTLYGHNSSLAVSPGQSVKRGQVIAYAGSTGNSTGPHCHFEVRVNGVAQNPRGWL
jgi:murein DD-endopeptidase MepM/ murein hydrolase activator NlpD